MERKHYNLNQSPFYKLTSHKKLASILNTKLSTLRKLLVRGNANYFFSTLDVEKRRDLEVPKKQLKRLHSRIHGLLVRIEPPDYLYSGVKGIKRSHIANARYHANGTALLKLDVKNFYPSTSFQSVERCFKRVFKCSSDVANTLAQICCVNGHLPTGSPISQSIAYFSNKAAFDQINRYARSRGLRFSVYVDDLTFSGTSIPSSLCDYVTGVLKKSGDYKCHKIRTHRAATPKVVTGVVIHGSTLRVKNSQRRKISDLLRGLGPHLSLHRNDDPSTVMYFHRLIGHLYSVGQFNGRYRQLAKKYVDERKALEIKAANQNTIKT